MGHDEKRAARQRIAEETIRICEEGIYQADDGEVHDISAKIKNAIACTEEFAPRDRVQFTDRAERRFTTKYAVTLETTLAAAHHLSTEGMSPLALNFASARNPGGGFLRGSMAQEESLAYASALYSCLRGREMYRYYAAAHFPSPLYEDYVILSPDVPVFRDDEGRLIEDWACGFVTSPAPNAGASLAHAADRRTALRDVESTLQNRLQKILAIAAYAGYKDLILGAWGCGVFACDPEMVARVFHQVLHGPFSGVFERVVFAIRESNMSHPTVRPFVRLFA